MKNSYNDIVVLFKWFYENGYITQRDGNACIHVKDGRYVVTPSGVPKHQLHTAPGIYVGDVEKVDGKPSIETAAHIYALRATGKEASVHVHSPKTVALFAVCDRTKEEWATKSLEAILNNNWPELFRYTKVGETIPFLAPGSAELHDAIAQSFKKGADIVTLQNHGVLAVGETLEECKEHIQRLEHISGILLDIVKASGKGFGGL